MDGHAYAAYLRVYQPLAAFPARERALWASYVESGESLPPQLALHREARRGLARALGLPLARERDHALVLRRGRTVYVCPLRTELRTLQSLVAFRRSLPEEVADAFVPRREAEQAAQTLDRLRRQRPTPRAFLLQSAWGVPLHWFALFDATERTVSPPHDGQPAQLRYQTSMSSARARVSRALVVLHDLLDESEPLAAAEELQEWLHEFDADSLVELDYGGLGRVISYDDLVADCSAAQVWEAIEALEEGDLERSSDRYAMLTEHWSALRIRQSSN